MDVNMRWTACSRAEPDQVEIVLAGLSRSGCSVTDSPMKSMEMGGSTAFPALSRQARREKGGGLLLTSLRVSTYQTTYASILRSLRPRRPPFCTSCAVVD